MQTPPADTSPAAPTSKKAARPVWITLLIVLGACVLCIPCTGVIAAITIPSFINYVKRSKAAEAHAELGALSAAVEASCRENRGVPINAGPLPAVPGGVKQVVDFTQDPGFAAIGYVQPSPIYYSYAVRTESDGTYVIAAEGDLDDDGSRSRFEVRCSAQCACADITTHDELE